ncbi:MAG TPA: SagB/ThcOx family dehydrogenase [Bacteroidales bacterium]|nr:SagB/ThcOx family dehydrogenase [Bacteroidales bacterium]
MKRILLILMVVLISVSVAGQEFKDISLNAPDLNKGMTIMKAFEKRASATAFSPKELSLQDLSDLLWAAAGINRSGSGKRTAPSAMNAQDVDIYLFTKEGTYLYDAKNNLLFARVQGDNRALVYDTQANFSSAPVFLVMISDISRFRGNDTARNMSWAAMDAGIISQNISLFCAGTGLMTRPRAFMNSEGIKKLLSLTESQYPLLNNPVGYPVQ